MSIKLYAATSLNMQESDIVLLQEHIDKYFLSISSAFGNAKYFTSRNTASEYNASHIAKGNDCHVIFQVEADTSHDAFAGHFPIKKINLVEFPAFDRSIAINMNTDTLVKKANEPRNPSYQRPFNLKNFYCNQKNFSGDLASLSKSSTDKPIPVSLFFTEAEKKTQNSKDQQFNYNVSVRF